MVADEKWTAGTDQMLQAVVRHFDDLMRASAAAPAAGAPPAAAASGAAAEAAPGAATESATPAKALGEKEPAALAYA